MQVAVIVISARNTGTEEITFNKIGGSIECKAVYVKIGDKMSQKYCSRTHKLDDIKTVVAYSYALTILQSHANPLASIKRVIFSIPFYLQSLYSSG